MRISFEPDLSNTFFCNLGLKILQRMYGLIDAFGPFCHLEILQFLKANSYFNSTHIELKFTSIIKFYMFFKFLESI